MPLCPCRLHLRCAAGGTPRLLFGGRLDRAQDLAAALCATAAQLEVVALGEDERECSKRRRTLSSQLRGRSAGLQQACSLLRRVDIAPLVPAHAAGAQTDNDDGDIVD